MREIVENVTILFDNAAFKDKHFKNCWIWRTDPQSNYFITDCTFETCWFSGVWHTKIMRGVLTNGNHDLLEAHNDDIQQLILNFSTPRFAWWSLQAWWRTRYGPFTV